MRPTTTQVSPSGIWIPRTTARNTGSFDGISIPATFIGKIRHVDVSIKGKVFVSFGSRSRLCEHVRLMSSISPQGGHPAEAHSTPSLQIEGGICDNRAVLTAGWLGLPVHSRANARRRDV